MKALAGSARHLCNLGRLLPAKREGAEQTEDERRHDREEAEDEYGRDDA
jgi:hypothetical protein